VTRGWLATAALVGAVSAAAACTDAAVDRTKADANAALEATQAGGETAIEATKAAGEEALDATATTADKAKDVAGDVVDKGKELASAAGDAVTDTWITAKVKAKIADEKSLSGSDISVETNDRLVTLTGSVPSASAKSRAVEIARGTERVTRVVDQLVVSEER
jgi:osmotically-inducible protein OsmY